MQRIDADKKWILFRHKKNVATKVQRHEDLKSEESEDFWPRMNANNHE